METPNITNDFFRKHEIYSVYPHKYYAYSHHYSSKLIQRSNINGWYSILMFHELKRHQKENNEYQKQTHSLWKHTPLKTSTWKFKMIQSNKTQYSTIQNIYCVYQNILKLSIRRSLDHVNSFSALKTKDWNLLHISK